MPTAQVTLSAEGLVDGAAVPLDNGPSTDLGAVDAGVTAVSAGARVGGLCYRVVPAVTNVTTLMRVNGPTTDQTVTSNNSLRCYVKFMARPVGASIQFIRMSSGTGATTRLGIGMDTFGKLFVIDSANAINGRIAASALPLNEWVRLEVMWHTGGGTALTDTCEVRVYNEGARQTQYEPPVNPGNFSTTTTTAAVSLGKTTATTMTSWGDIFFDDVLWTRAEKAEFGPALSPPVASFTKAPTSGDAPLTVNFTDTSTNSPTGWLWDFGDGTTSTAQNPAKVYSAPGTYTARVTASNPAGTSTSGGQGITVATPPPPPPVASYTASPATGQAPLSVSFTDTSTGVVASRSWNFAGQGSSTIANPTFVFNSPGSYEVTLTVTNAGGSNTKTTTFVVTEPPPTAGPGIYCYRGGVLVPATGVFARHEMP